MGNFVQKLIVHHTGAIEVLRDPGVSAGIAEHGEPMASRVNAMLQGMGNTFVRVHVVDSKSKGRSRTRVLITYPVSENLGNMLLSAIR